MAGGSYTLLGKDSIEELEVGTTYQLALELGEDTVKGVLYDSAGDSLIASTPTASDSTWASGQLGFYTDGANGYPTFYDIATKKPLDDSDAGNLIDSFEDGSLSKYTHDPTRSNSDATIRSTANGYPAYSGSNVLAIEDVNTEMISLQGDGLQNYPSAGDSFGCWTRATTGDANVNFTYGVQDHENRYYVKLQYSQSKVYIFKYEDEIGYVLGDAEDVPLETDTWYRIGINWDSNGTHTVTVTDKNGTQIAKCNGQDSAWDSGGIGFDAYMGTGGSTFFDYAVIHEAPGGGTSHIVDFFEGGSMDKRYTGQSDYSTTEIEDAGGYTLRGDYSAKLERGTGETGEPATLIARPSFFEHTPEAGDKFSVLFQPTVRERPSVLYGVQGDGERYRAMVNDDGSFTRYNIWREVNNDGWETVWHETRRYEETESHFSDDGWYELEIDWGEDGTHILTVYHWDDLEERGGKTQLGRLTATGDSSLTDGSFGYEIPRGPAYIDNVHVGDGYPINYDLTDSGTASATPSTQVDYYKSTELVQEEPQSITGTDNWGVTLHIGQFGVTTEQESDNLEPYIERQEIEVTYSERFEDRVLRPEDNDWYASHNFDDGTDSSAKTVLEDVIDNGVAFASANLPRRFAQGVVATEFFIGATNVAGYGTNSINITWDYTNTQEGPKRIGSTWLKLRPVLEPGEIFRFDINTTTSYRMGVTEEDSFHWTVTAPLE